MIGTAGCRPPAPGTRPPPDPLRLSHYRRRTEFFVVDVCSTTLPPSCRAGRPIDRPRRARVGGPVGGRAPHRSLHGPARRRSAGHPPGTRSALGTGTPDNIKGKQGFTVVDMTDVDLFRPIDQITLPTGPVYWVEGIERGDQMANWSPDEALPAIESSGRTPLTIGEGIFWLLQQPDALERGRCFMTIGSRLRKPDGALDPGHPPSGSATAPAVTDRRTATHRKSVGAGPATGTPGSALPRRCVAAPQQLNRPASSGMTKRKSAWTGPLTDRRGPPTLPRRWPAPHRGRYRDRR